MVREIKSTIRFATKTPLGPSISTLVNYLSYDADGAAQDVQRCMSETHVGKTHMQQLITLTRRREFQDWIKDTSQSSAILVHGNLEPSTFGNITPLSYLCAQIVKEFSSKNGVLVLSYFCGFHNRPRDKNANAASILCQIIGQLLSHPIAGLNDALDSIDRHCIKKIKQRDVDTLCQVFKDLIRQLQSREVVVFCLIDSISFYEIKARQEDTQTVLTALTDIVESQQEGRRKEARMIFKLMVTDAARTIWAYDYFRREERVDMRDVVCGASCNPLELELKR
jgi:hypothetical protein